MDFRQILNGDNFVAKGRSTSIQADVNNVAAALNAKIVPPPEAGKFCKEELAIFDLYIQGKADQDWFPHELLQVGQLAKLTHLFNESKDQLDREGSIVYNARGTPVQNPLYSVVDSLIRSQLALTRSLNLASSKVQKKEHILPRAEKQQNTKTTLSNRGSLLAVPISKPNK